ncbi:A/G-specific adenine glycosylase [Colletotrichum higginsianum]|uniref:Adenine DNA glycosylase n=1 Tax=Colletotrichum higginsianum (strain IMI 349063) TaxID=759273 RepID=H1VJB0_COLHI|nr:A/G-specific adenine glycosylase [Colletotrichum higginsianum IMI 349063]OBR03476.1 A/G-specific adenine glycosylase [Colletotrichum higginsianum IMI 349063]CCF40313.1 A/G-specific adenine glycosylase [Colletotrichum higginsianum]
MIERRSVRRQSSLAAAKRILAQVDDEPDDEPVRSISKRRKVAAKPREEDAFEADFAPRADDDDDDNDDEDGAKETKQKEEPEEIEGIEEALEPQPKRRKVEKTRKADTAKLHARLFGPSAQATATTKTTTTRPAEACSPRSRNHAVTYHSPLLLDGQPGRHGRDALLAWFDAVSTTRGMPWRKPWIDPREPRDDLRAALERRAYEVWISEIMLQQTRVAVVIDYWNRWMARWPTIQDLAAAPPEDVVSAWRGLGYYSRATRIHEAAKLVVGDPGWNGLMPADTAELEAKVPGVGRYTAGAISAIVFGRAAPMVDGNVLRVLSRQLGVFGNAKSDKTVIDLLWAAADALVKAVAKDGKDDDDDDDDDAEEKEPPTSDRPGRWGQALMELGSTVCTPKPNCGECPVTSTCRAYAEGLLLAAAKPRKGAGVVEDIEDLCSICEPFEEAAAAEDEAAASGGDSDTDAPKTARGAKKGAIKSRPAAKQATLSAFFSSKTTKDAEPSAPKQPAVNAKTLEVVANHAKRFPLKVVKKAVRSEEALVCAVRRRDGRFLVHRRPDKGLLAGLWELPSHTLPAATTTTKKGGSTAPSRRRDAQGYVAGLLDGNGGKPEVRHVVDLGSVPWLFSHLKLTMHVHLFEVDGDEDLGSSHVRHRWATAEEVDEESMGTGMRKCWALVRERMEE